LRLWRRAVEHDVVGHRRTSSLSGPAAARLGRSISARVRPLGGHPGIFEVTRAMPNGRATFEYGSAIIPVRLGDHSQRKPHRLAPYRRT
jgi:plasmid stabilization system protein ParE